MQKIWELKAYDEYFQYIKQGRKTVEGRAPDSSGKVDYTEMKRGDLLVLTNTDTGEQLTVIIEQSIHYDSVEEMLQAEGLDDCLPGTETIEEGVEKYYAIPGYKERIQQGGVFAIRIHLSE